jgi:hypothetical protein
MLIFLRYKRRVRKHNRRCRLFLTGLAWLACACGGGRDLTFGPDVVVQAFNIVPGCEGATANGEFSSTITADGENLVEIKRAVLSDGGSKTLSTELVLNVATGDEICVKSAGTEEHDSLANDELSEDEDCQTIEEGPGELAFQLEMTAAGCRLLVTAPATLAGPAASGE